MDKKNEHIDHLTPDIIQAYHSGKLTSEQMHQVEILMLENPLYDEGMEGIESIRTEDFANDLKTLNDRIDEKTQNKKKGFWTIYTKAAAITLLLVSSISLFYLTDSPELPTKTLSSIQEKTENDSSDVKPPFAEGPEAKPDSSQSDIEPPKTSAEKPVLKEITAKTEPVEDFFEVDDNSLNVDLLKGRVAGIEVDTSQKQMAEPKALTDPQSNSAFIAKSKAELINEQKALESKAAPKLQMSELMNALAPESPALSVGKLTVSGIITGAEDSLALPQVSIFVKGSQNGTSSSQEGKYELNNLTPGAMLVFRYIGYETVEVKVDFSQVLNIQLEVDNTSLGEVVVTAQGIAREKKSLGYSIDDATKLGKVSKTAPVGGFSAYRKYLKENLRYPETAKAKRVRGRVTLEFEVTQYGEPTNFRIIKGLGYGCDEEAIRLVKEGPEWIPKTVGPNNTPVRSTVKIRVRFRP